MEKVIKNLERYLLDVLDVQPKYTSWQSKNCLPLFILNSYDFYECNLLKNSCLLMIPKEGIVVTPANVKKHMDQVQSKWAGLCIYVNSAISSYNRHRLIRNRVPFIIPHNQMFLPELGIDLREYFFQTKSKRQEFSPATQAVIIYSLCHFAKGMKFASAQLAEVLGYSRMTLSRAFDELEANSIGEFHKEGRVRWWLFEGSKSDLWNQTTPFLRNPVKQLIWIKGEKPKIKAGLTALSEYSSLNPPKVPVFAVGIEQWKQWEKNGVQVLPISEEAWAELEIWHYNPSLFAFRNVVDPFSLYLSLQESKDERVESALQEMMEKQI